MAATVGAGVALERWIRREDPVAWSWRPGAEHGGKHGGGTVDLDGGAATSRTSTTGGGISTATASLTPARLPRRI
jgi:hypothetical protein